VRKRLLAAMLLVTALAVVGFGVPLAVSVQKAYRDEAMLKLSEEGARGVAAVPATFAAENDAPELPDPSSDVDVALYGLDGIRVTGRGPDQADAAVIAVLKSGSAERRRGALVVALPINNEEAVAGVIRTSTPNSAVTRRTYRAWGLMFAWAVAVLAAAGALAARRSRSLARPLAQLRDDASVIGGGGELSVRASSGIEEIDTVHAALGDAATRLNAAMVRERSFSADVAHQLRTPLASLRLRLETEQLSAGHDRVLVDGALADVDRLEQTVNDVTALARDVERTSLDVSSLVRACVDRWRPLVERAGRQLVVDVAADLPRVEAREQAVRQIIDVLVDNALRHGAGPVGVSVNCIGDGAVVAVSDSGSAVLDAREIFGRRNPSAAGSGIGLALAHRLAEAEDMRLVLAHPGPGATFHLVIGGAAAADPSTRAPSRTGQT
jgi:signal transduction histidine kinase